MRLDYLSRLYDNRNLSREFNQLCLSQRIRTGSTVQNFSVLAMVLVIVLSMVIIVLSATLPSCVLSLRSRRRRRNRLSPEAEMRYLARLADEKYELLRMALENGGVERWETGKWGIPVTDDAAKIVPRTLQGGLGGYEVRPSVATSEWSSTSGTDAGSAPEKALSLVKNAEIAKEPPEN